MEKMRKLLREEKGFTLIELAIVLVIIGIILGAVLKGQDLIAGARAKKFVNDAGRKWEVGAWTHFDRKGTFPGDPDGNGLIGELVTDDPLGDLGNLNLINPPTSPVSFGSMRFYVFLGSDHVGGANPQNILVICRNDLCDSAFTADELAFVEQFDTAIDGVSNGAAGLVRGVNTAPDVLDDALGVGGYNADLPGLAWGVATQALVYFFDRPSNL